MNANEIIEKLGLKPLPEEGGFYKETFRDQGMIPNSELPHLDGEHTYSTCIYYLITPEEFSGLHAVKSTEIFHFYAGDPVEMVQITESGNLTKKILSSNIESGHEPQVIVTPNVWQGTKLIGDGKWALLGCTVAPGFEFSDFLGGTFTELIKVFPNHKNVIKEFTHQ